MRSRGRAGTRVTGRPVAALRAAATAAVDESDGGSPAPRRPSGPCGSPGSTRSTTTSGTSAAVAAARLGADVTLVERYNHLGGLATGGQVLALPKFHDKGRLIIGGVGMETRERLLKRGEAVYRGGGDASLFDMESLKSLSVQLGTSKSSIPASIWARARSGNSLS